MRYSWLRPQLRQDHLSLIMIKQDNKITIKNSKSKNPIKVHQMKPKEIGNSDSRPIKGLEITGKG